MQSYIQGSQTYTGWDVAQNKKGYICTSMDTEVTRKMVVPRIIFPDIQQFSYVASSDRTLWYTNSGY